MSAPTLAQRLALRTRPPGTPVLHQRWESLLFLHWRWDAAALQARLPPGLTLDTCDGEAWLGIVPFFMGGVRPRGLPAAPWLSDFPELNLRTYVHDTAGRSGVWFFSLDCSQPVAVELAQRLFHLPYRHARMTATRTPTATGVHVRFQSARRARSAMAPVVDTFDYAPAGPAAPVVDGSREFFLFERYAYFSRHNRHGTLLFGRVAHMPYQIAPATLTRYGTHVIALAGLPPPERPPDLVHAAAGFSVECFAPSCPPA